MRQLSTKIKLDSALFTFLMACLLLLIFKSMRLYLVWNLSLLLISVISLIAVFFYAGFNFDKYRKANLYNLILAIWLCISLTYEFFAAYEISVFSVIAMFATMTTSVLLIFSDIQAQKKILYYISTVTTILVGISLFFWILFLIGVQLPNYYTDEDPFYIHTVYYFFLLNGTPTEQIVPRFAGMFVEPGHLGTTCCFLLYIQHFNLKKIGNIILLLAILMSFSLAAYGLLIGGFGLYHFFNSRKGFLLICLLTFTMVAIGMISTQYNSGENILYREIFSRLIFEDGEMSGNNRTTIAFDSVYNRFIKTSKIWLGMWRDAFESKGSTNILNGTAGWKRYVYVRGVIGTSLILSFLIFYFLKYRSKISFGFLIVFIVANMIRDYPLKEYWLFIFLLAMPALSKTLYEKKQN